MSDFASQMIAARIDAVNAKISTRISSASSQSGISFSDLYLQTIAVAPVTAATEVETEEVKEAFPTETSPTEVSPNTAATGVSASYTSTRTRNNYDEIIGEMSEKYDVNSALVRAVVWAESNFNNTAVSTQGALGLMQLMPSVATSMGVTNAFDATQNINAGTQLLSERIKLYNGDIKMALASYNCGAGGLSNRGITNLDDPAQFALLPKETQTYLSRIEGYLDSVGLSNLFSPQGDN